MENLHTDQRVTNRKRYSWEISEMINRNVYMHKRKKVNRWYSSELIKWVHIINGHATLSYNGSQTLSYDLDKLPNFINRHIDFDVLNKNLKENTLEFRSCGLLFHEGKLIPKDDMGWQTWATGVISKAEKLISKN